MPPERNPSPDEAWKPGDPERRKANRSLLDLTATVREEHRPADHPLSRNRRANRAEVSAHVQRRMRCKCECARPECRRQLAIAIEVYEIVRANPDQFIVAPGHQAEGEEIISETPAFVVLRRATARP